MYVHPVLYGYTVGNGTDESHPFDFIVLVEFSMLGAPLACTPYIFTFGFRCLIAKATPEISPPPAYRNDYGIQVGQLFQ